MEKLLAMNVAATLASAVIANLPDDLKRDVDIKDPTLRAENLMAWELQRIFYHAVVGALEDDQSWPGPKVDMGNMVDNVLDKLVPLFTGTGPLAEILQKLIAAIPTPAPAQGKLPADLPNPGQATS